MHKALLVSILGFSLASAGCLSSSHRIGKSELLRLSRTAPEQRGNHVRVVQSVGGREAPPRAEPVQSTTVVYVESPVWVDGSPRRHDYYENSRASASTSTGGGNVGGGHHHSRFGNVAAGKKDAGKALLIIAAAAAVGLAFTEGARYDGWVKVHPMQPVHLYGRYGGYTVLPLAQIDERTAAWADRAYIRDDEGPFKRLGRAPLNRRGFTYSLLLGTGEVPVQDYNADPGFNGHIQFGYFFNRQIGLNLDLGMAWTNDQFQNTIYTSRTALELQAYLVRIGSLHAGLFGQLGGSSRFDDGIASATSSGLLGGGAQLQLDLTTRLAITARAGVTNSFGETSKEASLGVSIY